ncbi:alpha/beta hydrolase-fold protein [bacterium]|nr:alpha/beta hydrolase-fold protein [bacterium]
MKKYSMSSLMIVMSFCLITWSVYFESVAQEAPRSDQERPPTQRSGMGSAVISPEVGADGTITFRYLAPNAKEIIVSGELDGKVYPMTKDTSGVWSVMIGPLPPDIYTYSFSVDGVIALDPRNPNTKYGYGRFGAVSIVQVPGDGPQFYDVKPVPHGVVRIHPYESKSMGVNRTVWIYTPPGYEQGANYPVLYLIHGAGDIESGWTLIGRANNILDNLIAEGKARPMVVVMPLGHAIQSFWAGPAKNAVNTGSGGSVGIGGPQGLNTFGRDLIEDVMPLVEREYKISTKADDRAIGGLSMGGSLTMNVGFNRTDLFRYIVIMSSAGQNADQAYPDFFNNADTINKQLKLLWIGVGKDDSLVGNRSEELVDLLTEKGINHIYRVTEGRHEWTVWRYHLNEVAPLLFK